MLSQVPAVRRDFAFSLAAVLPTYTARLTTLYRCVLSCTPLPNGLTASKSCSIRHTSKTKRLQRRFDQPEVGCTETYSTVFRVLVPTHCTLFHGTTSVYHTTTAQSVTAHPAHRLHKKITFRKLSQNSISDPACPAVQPQDWL